MNNAAKPMATLSLDMDNLWSYQRSFGNTAWRDYPGFLHCAVPRILELLQARRLHITFFIVGRDATQPQHQQLLQAIHAAGHELANHSYSHDPLLATMQRDAMADEVLRSAQAIEAATGQKPIGFRGPAFSVSATLIHLLQQQGYVYDASSFPTILGPLARAYQHKKSAISRAEKQAQAGIYGGMAAASGPLRPFHWKLAGQQLLELPVTTMPFLRLPVHLTYVNFLADHSAALARGYLNTALQLCRWRNINPSLLLHATDFLGRDDPFDLNGLPGMQRTAMQKTEFLGGIIDDYMQHFEVLTMSQAAARVSKDANLASIEPPSGASGAKS